MARTVKSALDRREQILDVASRLFAERGYGNTSVQAIIEDVGIAKGTFYHHFASKVALIDGLVMRFVQQLVHMVGAIVDDPDPGAVHKFNVLFERLDAWKTSNLTLMMDLGRALEDDANAQVLKHLRDAQYVAFVPLLAQVVEHGVREGVFDVPDPLVAAQLVLYIGESLGVTIQRLAAANAASLASILASLDAHHQAIERILGAEPNSLHIVQPDSVGRWVAVLRETP